MKNGYLTIGLSLFLLTFFPCRAQEESPGMDYLEENKTWSSHHSIYNNGSWSTLSWIEGEMEVSGMVWKKLYSSRHEDRSGASYILLRQEGRKVYSCHTLDNYQTCEESLLLFDFGLEAGDTIQVVPAPFGYMVVERVFDSVFLPGQAGRRCIELVDLDSIRTDLWVEGIGSLYTGIGGTNLLNTSNMVLLCVQSDTGYEYRNGNYSTCFIEESAAEPAEEKLAACQVRMVTPGGQVEFLFAEPQAGYLQIFDRIGRCLLQVRLSGTSHRIAPLEPGVYLYRLLNPAKTLVPGGTGKFLSL